MECSTASHRLFGGIVLAESTRVRPVGYRDTYLFRPFFIMNGLRRVRPAPSRSAFIRVINRLRCSETYVCDVCAVT